MFWSRQFLIYGLLALLVASFAGGIFGEVRQQVATESEPARATIASRQATHVRVEAPSLANSTPQSAQPALLTANNAGNNPVLMLASASGSALQQPSTWQSGFVTQVPSTESDHVDAAQVSSSASLSTNSARELLASSPSNPHSSVDLATDDPASDIAEVASLTEVEALPAPVASFAEAASTESGRLYHLVQPGDSLSTIANRFGLRPDDLMLINGLRSTVIHHGQKLYLEPDADVAAQEFADYTVQRGDTLSSIAARFDMSIDELMVFNDLNSLLIRQGQTLKVRQHDLMERVDAALRANGTSPAATGESNTETLVESVADALASSAEEVADNDSSIATASADNANNDLAANVQDVQLEVLPQIIVKPGDTLWALAQRHGTTIAAIVDVNNFTGYDLMPGAIVRLPLESNVNPDSYIVQPGDTLHDIAVAFSTTVDSLIAINNLDGSRIYAGQTLALTSEEPIALLEVTVAPGDSLWLLAQRHDVSIAALREANALSSSTLRPGDQLVIPGRYANSNISAETGSTGGVGGGSPPTVTVRRGQSLWTIARENNTSVTALMSANNLRSTNIMAGQTLRIVSAAELASTAATSTASQAAVHESLWGSAQAAQRETTPAPSSHDMVWPLNGPITSHFGYRRLRINGSNYHTGLDIDGNVGDLIVSATAGRVTFSGWRGGYGQLLIIESNGREYYYAHASALLVAAGAHVTAGQNIARVGATGAVTGPHLHFEIRVNGTPVDPYPILESRAVRLRR